MAALVFKAAIFILVNMYLCGMQALLQTIFLVNSLPAKTKHHQHLNFN